jgi:SPP1 gp7 family putative phage head morphogenesis protein
MYATQIRGELTGAIDTGALAEAWAALHPGALKAGGPGERSFLQRALDALSAALQRVLQRLWPEAWVLGQQSAHALSTGSEVDWAGWKPGDWEAAAQVAGDGLQRLLDEADVRIKSIAADRVGELADVLAVYIGSDVAHRPPLPEPLPPQHSVGDLADALHDVLDNPSRAELVAVTEIARAQSAAALDTYRQMGVLEEEISTADDARVCPICDAAAAAGPKPIGTYVLPLHPRCRCARVSVLAARSELAAARAREAVPA